MVRSISCLRSQSYEFESNSQPIVSTRRSNLCCLRSQSYEFESNSQLTGIGIVRETGCLRSQSYEFESNSQLPTFESPFAVLFEVTKLRIWKQLTTFHSKIVKKLLLFEVTKLRIWKQLTTSFPNYYSRGRLFEVTKLRIWKQLTTGVLLATLPKGCLRSQSYEFESNSQHRKQNKMSGCVVWGHKVMNLKATHNSIVQKKHLRPVVWGQKVTNLKATHN